MNRMKSLHMAGMLGGPHPQGKYRSESNLSTGSAR